MADPLRVGLFALSLASVVASSLLVVGRWRLGGAGSLLAVWVVGCAQVVLLTEGLSLLGALDWPGLLLGQLLILGGVAAWAWRRPPAERWRALGAPRAGLARLWPLLSDWRAPAVPIVTAAVLVIGLISLTLALWVPPNISDALSYHMPRVGYYLQFRSLGHYPVDDPRQVAFPVNAELLILWTVAFLRADWLANTVELAAWAATAVGVYGLGRQVGFGPRAALFAAGVFALLPQPVLQSTSTWNDLVAASFVVASLYFLLQGSGVRDQGPGDGGPGPAPGPRPPAPGPCLVLAGAAAGLAVGTKGTALLAVPGLAVAFVALFGRRLDRGVLVGTLLGGVAALLVGSYIYVQNWLVYGAPSPPAFKLETAVGEITPAGFAANLARTLYRFAFADLHGPLFHPAARPLRDLIDGALAAAGERVFAAFGIPRVVEGLDIPGWGEFTFIPGPAVLYYSGVGPIGGLILVFALAALAWPGRIPPGRRLLGFAAISYVVLMAATLRWNPFAGGRFLIAACAVAAPLLGALLRNDACRMSNDERGRHAAFRTALALVVALWSGVTALYVATFNEDKPVSRLLGRGRPDLMSPRYPNREQFFREIDQELGPTSTVGVYDNYDALADRKDQWEYPFFGPRLTRTVLPLVRPGYADRMRTARPPPWTNDDLVSAHPPTYVALYGWSEAGPARRLTYLHANCFELPLEHAKPALPWELWRCREDDPRSVLEHGDFQAGPSGWDVEVAGEGRLDARALEPAAGGEPFRLRLEYRAGGDATAEGGIVQDVPPGALGGKVLVVDARVWADVEGAAVLWVDDGVGATEVANQTTAPETLRVSHAVHPRATGLAVHLDASGAGRDATVRVRTILAIPRGP